MLMKMRLWLLLPALFLSPAGSAMAGFEEDGETKKWEESEVQLPVFPRQQELLGFYVSASTDNRFSVDPASISVGRDGVIRYTLVVMTAAGSTNISFEGMRCETRERRLYALGRSDGTWSKARNSQWERVREVTSNRHHAALFQEYFCPGGVVVGSSEEAVNALRRGGHPSAARW